VRVLSYQFARALGAGEMAMRAVFPASFGGAVEVSP
jgi:hypothetical protein